MGRERAEEYFKKLAEALEKRSRRLTVEWRRDEAFGQIQLGEDFYVFIVLSWAGDEYYIEYMVGDENAVVQARHVDMLDEAVSIIKEAHGLAAKMGLIS
ncbi:hypothetical protein TUZN_2009 [Thermoproteus uzoniensis 768-20]|uniref:Uncharacterized protein n=1 Tax=Thermoproteus uzoniensis (strain 768-20) TaxID=999630 RepID=F2L4W3_THEU7|nr:hypothetical protein [Thermoproteus uzoniensis]AEA13467.1 hypothetical protein TUZN_2009 [Thermoproteus uzoniensis 768-20]